MSREFRMIASKSASGSLVVLLCLVVQGCVALGGKKSEEKTIALDQAPPAVRDSITKSVKGNKLERVTKENEDGAVVYEAQFHSSGVRHSLSLRETGEILEDEQSINVSDLPPAVTQAVAAKHPDGRLSEAELVEAGGKRTYEVMVSIGKSEREVRVTPDGQIQSDEAEEHDAKDKD